MLNKYLCICECTSQKGGLHEEAGLQPVVRVLLAELVESSVVLTNAGRDRNYWHSFPLVSSVSSCKDFLLKKILKAWGFDISALEVFKNLKALF